MSSGVGGRPDQDKIIPRNLPARRAITFVDEFPLRRRIVHQHDIRLTPPRHIERPRRRLANDFDGDARLRRELRQDVRENPVSSTEVVDTRVMVCSAAGAE